MVECFANNIFVMEDRFRFPDARLGTPLLREVPQEHQSVEAGGSLELPAGRGYKFVVQILDHEGGVFDEVTLSMWDTDLVTLQEGLGRTDVGGLKGVSVVRKERAYLNYFVEVHSARGIGRVGLSADGQKIIVKMNVAARVWREEDMMLSDPVGQEEGGDEEVRVEVESLWIGRHSFRPEGWVRRQLRGLLDVIRSI